MGLVIGFCCIMAGGGMLGFAMTPPGTPGLP